MAITADKPKQPEPQDKPKTRWDSILTSTPVVLTVLATLLAGLSSSEMTRAQYHRSLAAQHQSKAGDQWGFFQAKRIRGTSMENNVRMVRATHDVGPVSRDDMITFAQQLPRDLVQLSKDAEQLLAALAKAESDLAPPTAEGLRQAAERIRAAATKNGPLAQSLGKKLEATLAQSEVAQALAWLSGGLPESEPAPVGNAEILEAERAIRARQPERETAALMGKISHPSLQEALDAADGNAAAFDKMARPISRAFSDLNKLIAELNGLASSVHRPALLVEETMRDVYGNTQAITGLRTPANAIGRTERSLNRASSQLQRDFMAAQDDFEARRYRREADDNQAIAQVYEVQVRKSSWESDRHRTRSERFFYGMLAAQAGVTIATLALAMRRRSVLWLLASVAGVAAILFSAYVYVYV
jgi:hypothetical protein